METKKLGLSVLAAFALCAPFGANAATPPVPEATALKGASLSVTPSQAALQDIIQKAQQPDRLRTAFIRESGPSWVQWLNRHKVK